MNVRSAPEESPTPADFFSDSPDLSDFSAPRWYWVLLFAALGAAYWVVNRQRVIDMWSEDLPVYAHALHAWLTGGDPYSPAMAPLHFLYPPAFLVMASALAHLVPAGWGPGLYTAWHLAATCALPLVLARWYFRRRWLSLPLALVAFFETPRFVGLLGLCTLNVATTFYFLAFVAAIPGLKRDRWIWFYGVVLAAACTKVTFLSLLLLPVFAGRREWWKSIACAAAVVGINLLEMAVSPGLYASYRWSLMQGIVKQGAYGFGVFGIVSAFGYKVHIPEPLGAYAAAGLLAVAMVGTLLLLRRRLMRRNAWTPEMRCAWLAMVVVAVIQVNPRLLQYDGDISLFAAYMLWVYLLRTRRVLVVLAAILLPSMLIQLVIQAVHMYGLYGTGLTLIAFGLTAWRLWQETGHEPANARSWDELREPEEMRTDGVSLSPA